MKPADLIPPGSYNRAVGTVVDMLGKAELKAALALRRLLPDHPAVATRAEDAR